MISIDVGAVINEVRALSPFRQTVPSSEVDAAFLSAGSPHKVNGWGRWAGVLVRTDEGTNALYHATQFQRLWVISDAEQTSHRIFSQAEAQGVADRLAADLKIRLGGGSQWRTRGRVVAFQQPAPVVQRPPVAQPAPAPAAQQPPVVQRPAPVSYPSPVAYPPAPTARPTAITKPPSQGGAAPSVVSSDAPSYTQPPADDGVSPWWYAAGALLVAGAAILIITDD